MTGIIDGPISVSAIISLSGGVGYMKTDRTTIGPGGSCSYVPYAATPGDLHSYTPESWNAPTAELGFKGNYF
jgi:hypothetical protein